MLLCVHLESHDRACGSTATSPLAGRRVIDVSAGAGVCSVGCGLAGAHVVSTDIPEQLPLLAENVARHKLAVAECGGSISVATYIWGEPLSALTSLCTTESPASGMSSVPLAFISGFLVGTASAQTAVTRMH